MEGETFYALNGPTWSHNGAGRGPLDFEFGLVCCCFWSLHQSMSLDLAGVGGGRLGADVVSTSPFSPWQWHAGSTRGLSLLQRRPGVLSSTGQKAQHPMLCKPIFARSRKVLEDVLGT